MALAIEKRSVQQVATLPFVPIGASVDILLISSRRRKRWVVPKGWPVKRLSFPESAASEAAEEAGIIGPVFGEPIGSYMYPKQMDEGYEVPCHVFVYPVLVLEHRLDWPEREERFLKWVSLDEAVELVDDADLSTLLADLAENGGMALRSIVSSMIAEPAAYALD